MKKYGFFILAIAAAVFFISATIISSSPESPETFPEDIGKIIDKSCFGCHNTDSQNEDAREELDFNELDELKKVKKITTFRDIAEVVEKGEMPPEKFLERYPDKQLSDEEKAKLAEWAKKEAQKLIGN
jgi:hypothetical protein